MAIVQPLHTAVSGRARFRVDGLYRSEALGRYLESNLARKDGIRSVSVNSLTGNILILFHPDLPHSEIASQVDSLVSEHCKELILGGMAEQGKRKTGHRCPPISEACSLIKSHLSTLDSSPFKPKGNRNRSRNPTASLPSQTIASRHKIRKSIVRAEDQEIQPWHALAGEHALQHFETVQTTGLASATARDRLKKYGPNILPEAISRSRWMILIDQFKSLPVYLLSAAAGASILTGGFVDALLILGVVGINAAIGYATESHSEKVIHSLKTLVRPSALVRRDGRLREIGSEEVVPGDILVLRPGSYVAADGRLLEAQHLFIDESALTGESVPVAKTPASILPQGIPLADRANMTYRGTLVTGGQGLALVVATGRFSEFGRIQVLIGEAKHPETPMEKQLKKAGSQLVYLCGAVCGLVFLIGLMRRYGLLQMFQVSISLAVAAVPEGLPAVATTTLALGIRNMQRHHALIRRLDAVETLGSVQVMCLDKTGTITMNRMSVAAVHANMQSMRVFDHRFMSQGKEISPYACEALLKLIHVSVLCNESEIFPDDSGYRMEGSPTENALLHMAIGAGIDVMALRLQFRMLQINYRSEKRNFVMTLHSAAHSHYSILAVKGSPTEVLSICSYYLQDGERVPLTEGERLVIETENERMAGEALRVLGFAYTLIPEDSASWESEEEGPKDLIWIGLVGMGDPIRPGVKELIGDFRRAGIDTIMITGDQTPTAFAIAKELRLSQDEEQLGILDSTHLEEMDADVLKALCEKVLVFSRVSPAHKLQIVHALQRAGKVVAMTGDGINDGPALKAAEIGIAMGHTGTDVAREVADVVLEDDSLETMIVAVSQGRTIYNNIRKTVHYLLSTNLSEIMVMFTATAAGLGQPLNAMQLLWINLISDIFPGLALALEPPEPDVLSVPPRDPNEPIIQSKDFKRVAFEATTLSASALGAYGVGIIRYGVGRRASTLCFMSLSSAQILHSLSCRSRRHSLFDRLEGQAPLQPNRYLRLAIGGTLGLQAASLILPGLRAVLGIAPLTLFDGLLIGTSAIWPLMINEATKRRLKAE